MSDFSANVSFISMRAISARLDVESQSALSPSPQSPKLLEQWSRSRNDDHRLVSRVNQSFAADQEILTRVMGAADGVIATRPGLEGACIWPV